MAEQASGSAGRRLMDEFAHAVRTGGESPAIVAEGRRMSYAALDRASGVLGRKLAELGVGEGTLLGVMTGRTVDVAVAYLASLKAGAAFMPLSPEAPVERNQRILRESRAGLLLTTSEVLAASRAERDYQGAAHIIDIATLTESGTPYQALSDAVPAGTAYVIHTSGSTGEPKGAGNTTEALLNLVAGLASTVYPADAKRRNVAMVAPFTFDPSIQQLFGAVLRGHCLHLVPEQARFDGGALLSFFNESKIDIADGTPTHLRLLANAPASLGDRLSPDLLLIGGEALTLEVVSAFWQRFGGPEAVAIVNLYGTAECAVDATAYRLDAAEIQHLGFVPIGLPLPNVNVRIVDAEASEPPIGEVGEIVISGRAVGSGYVGRPEMTRERFGETTNGERFYRTGDLGSRDAGGLLRCHGRLDRQLKIRGVRIEPGEIEVAMREFRSNAPGVADGVAHCKRCLLDTRHPGVTVTDGMCSVCVRFDAYREKASGYFGTEVDFARLMEEASVDRRSEEHCLLLYSGGKDSSYVLLRLIELGYRVATFTFDNGYISKAALENIDRTTTRYGIRHVTASLAQMKEVFSESLRHESTVCDGCFRALTLLSTQLARKRGINVVVTGLSRGQIFETKLKRLFEHGVFGPEEIDQRLNTHRQIFNVREDPIARSVGLNKVVASEDDTIRHVDFFRYNSATAADVRRYLVSRDERWRAPKDTGFCSTNCRVNDVGIGVHLLERGFHNYAAPLSWDIRLGVRSRADAVEELREPVDNANVRSILSELKYTPRDQSRGKIQESAVALRQGPAGQPMLCAYFVSSGRVNVAELRDHLARRLPDYMIPTHVIRVDEIPVSTNGKVDFAKLPLPAIQEEAAAPRDPAAIETRLRRLWREVLAVESIGLDDNFFDLGGDSLLATILVSQIEAELGQRTSVVDIFSHASIREMARHLQSPTRAGHECAPRGGAC